MIFRDKGFVVLDVATCACNFICYVFYYEDALALIATLFTLIVSLLGSSPVMQFLLPKNHNILGCGKSSRKNESSSLLSHFLYSLGSSKAPSFQWPSKV